MGWLNFGGKKRKQGKGFGNSQQGKSRKPRKTFILEKIVTPSAGVGGWLQDFDSLHQLLGSWSLSDLDLPNFLADSGVCPIDPSGAPTNNLPPLIDFDPLGLQQPQHPPEAFDVQGAFDTLPPPLILPIDPPGTKFKVDPETGIEYEPGTLLVKFKQELTEAEISKLAETQGAIGVENLFQGDSSDSADGQWKVLKFQADVDLLQIRTVLSQLPSIAGIELNYKLSINATRDPMVNSLWGLNNTGQTRGRFDADIDAPEAWRIQTGSKAVTVAVIDTGGDYRHQDLAANSWQNTREIAGNGVDDDRNGFIDDVHGYDFVNRDGDPMDDEGHGTHVAGTIGAVGNNNIGVVGVNHNVSLMHLKFLDSSGNGNTLDAARAVDYATRMGAKVINASFGGGGYSPSMFDAISRANNAGVLFVGAAGNSSNNNDSNPAFPANYDLPNVISVAATDHNDQLAWFSNYGRNTVDMGAPGVGIWSTLPGNRYGSFQGTSMAAPHVAGAAALLLAQKSNQSPTQLKNLLMQTVDPVASLQGKTVTGGRLNIHRALSQIAPPNFEMGRVSSRVGSVPLNMRSQPNTSQAPIGTLSVGTELKILRSVQGGTYNPGNGNRNDWYEIEVGGKRGYVAAYYVDKGSSNQNPGLQFSTVTSKATGKALDAGGSNNSVYPHPSPNAGNEFQQWGFEKVGDYYMIINKATGKALDAGGGHNTLPYIHPDPNTQNPFHLWNLQQVGDAYVIINKATGRVLDSGGSSGNQIYMHPTPMSWNPFHLWKLNLPNGGNPGHLNPLVTRQGAQYFKDRPQFYTTGNIFAQSMYGSSLVGGRGYTEGNCTWYAHGRLLQMGKNPSALRTMSGNANQWHNQMSNGTGAFSSPQVGDIAQWTANGANHVAVVEQVHSNGTITISESHYDTNWDGGSSGTLHWVRTISASSPTRYIRVPNA